MGTVDLYIATLYREGQSPYEIAEKIGKNHMYVRRRLKAMGIPLRDKSEGQKVALASGRAKHPKQKATEDGGENTLEEKNDESKNT